MDQAKPIFLKDPTAMIPLTLLLAKNPPKLVNGETADAMHSVWEGGGILTWTGR
jgi:hypothetical protein